MIEIEYILKKKTHALYPLFYSKEFYFVMQNLWLINIVRDMAKLDEYAIRLKNWTTLNPNNPNSYRYKLSSRLNQRNQIDKMLSTGLVFASHYKWRLFDRFSSPLYIKWSTWNWCKVTCIQQVRIASPAIHRNCMSLIY